MEGGKEGKWRKNEHGIPHPVAHGGDTGPPELQWIVLLLSTGSVVESTVVGCGLGVMVMGTGVPVVPPVIVVLDPTVSVVADSVYVSKPQNTTVAFCVVVVGSSMEVVPLQTLFRFIVSYRRTITANVEDKFW